jgi:hypothetical protein
VYAEGDVQLSSFTYAQLAREKEPPRLNIQYRGEIQVKVCVVLCALSKQRGKSVSLAAADLIFVCRLHLHLRCV